MQSKIVTVSRFVLGAVFVVFGLNGFLQFLPMPAPTGQAAVFMQGLAAAGYLFPLLKAVEVVAGVLLLTNRLVPFALTLLAPVIVNIAGFHLSVAPEGLPMVAVILAAEVHLAWAHRASFAPLFARTPRADRASAPTGAAVAHT